MNLIGRNAFSPPQTSLDVLRHHYICQRLSNAVPGDFCHLEFWKYSSQGYDWVSKLFGDVSPWNPWIQATLNVEEEALGPWSFPWLLEGSEGQEVTGSDLS